MDRRQVEAYLGRLGMSVPAEPDLATLRLLQERHIYTVPFENLDIVDGRLPLSLETDDLLDKVVMRKRGGICYELNLLFADLLGSLGYGVALLSGRHPKYGDDFDHAFLVATVPGEAARWVVDVGFADNFRTPLLFDGSTRQADGCNASRQADDCGLVWQDDDCVFACQGNDAALSWQDDGRDEYAFRPARDLPGYWELVRHRAGGVAVMYTFSLAERERADYRPRCDWYCTSLQSRFTQGPLVSIERPEGRISLTMNRVLNTFDGQRIREDLQTPAEFATALHDIFGIA